jgi:hypothetical protein
MKRMFYVRARWDGEAKVYYSESDIFGLHIEAATIEEFEAVMNDVAADLIIANHYSAQDIATKPLRDLVPTILWQRPEPIPTAA